MNKLDLEHWVLVGPGAVGLYYGGRIAKFARLGVLARSGAKVLETDGICIKMLDPSTGKTLQVLHAPLEYVTEKAESIVPQDYVIIATKSTVNEELIKPLRSIIKPDHTTILCLQNGMGNAEFFSKYFPRNPILLGLCFVCVNRVEPAIVENYHTGRVEIGSLGDLWPKHAQAVVEVFNDSGIYTKHAEILDAALWRKLCWNVPFNGLCITQGGITTEKIIENAPLARRARVLMEEVREAAAIEGHVIPDTFLAAQFSLTEKMRAYKPSSLIDYLAGKPVELESIWGKPLRRGLAQGAKMPELAKLYNQLKALLD